MNSHTYTVYTIRDADCCVRYVGMTRRSLRDRLKQHRISQNEFGSWCRSELEKCRPLEICLEESFAAGKSLRSQIAARVNAMHAEKSYIQGYRKLLGARLFNKQFVDRLDGLLKVSA